MAPKPLTKPVNMMLAGYSYIRSLFNKEHSEVSGMPVSLGVELTNMCNLRCPECPSGSGDMTRERGFMDPELFKKVIGELKPYLYFINLYFQGEPMLHPQFVTFIENCRGIYSTMSTNGHYLSDEAADNIVRAGLKHLIVSVDGADQETYSSYRVNGDLDKVIKGLASVAEAKARYRSKIRIEIQMLVNRINEHQIASVRKIARDLNASFRLKSMQIINNDKMEYWLPGRRLYRRYRKTDGEYIIRNILPDRCARLWFNPVITWDGKVIPCCFDKNSDHILGDLNEECFRDIWNGPRYRIFRQALLKDRSMIEICRNCTSGLRGVKY